MTSIAGDESQRPAALRQATGTWGTAQTAFLVLCLASEAILFLYDRGSAYIGLGAFAYSLILWIITRSCIKYDPAAEDVGLRTRASGLRLYARVAVVAATLLFVAYETSWGAALVWNSRAEVFVQHVSAAIGLGYGDTALPNFLVYVLIPGFLLFALGAKPLELGLAAWQKGSWHALLGAFILPAVFIGIWFSKGHGAIGLLTFMLVRNFLSNGFSEEFLTRGMAMSHLRAFFTKDWGLVLQAMLFGLLHFGGTISEQHGNWVMAFANVIALNAPTGFFLGLIALRARSIVLPGLIHMTLDTLKDVVM